MFYVVRVKGWPVLVWLERAPAARGYVVIGAFDDPLEASAAFCADLERARETAREDRAARLAYAPPAANTMSPLPPDAKNRPTYDSRT